MRDRTLVIGGTSGIGKAIAERLQFDVYPVSCPDIEQLDVTDPHSVSDYFETWSFKWIVYCAGVNHLMPIGDIGNSDLEQIFDVNVMGFIRVLNAACAPGKERPTSVLAIVSDSATVPMRHSIAYASSKAALAHAIRCAARELAPDTRVNGISPSIVDCTPMTDDMDLLVPRMRGWTPEEARAYETSLVPMGRRCTKAEVAGLACSILAGPNFMTGAVVPLSGGK